MYKRFMAPREHVPLQDHTPKEILILTRAEFRPEWFPFIFDNQFSEKHISRSPLHSINDETCWITRPIIEMTFHNPLRRLSFIPRLDRTEYAGNTSRLAFGK